MVGVVHSVQKTHIYRRNSISNRTLEFFESFTMWNLFPVLLSLLIVLVLSWAFRKSSKTDKGRRIFYYKLSYRRKMIRDLWTIPPAYLFLGVVLYFTPVGLGFKLLVMGALIVLGALNVCYNYYMWKKSEAKVN